MGSLMAGWASPVSDPDEVILKRNKSMTKEEIEAYWKTKRLLQQQHLSDILASMQNTQESNQNLERSRSMPPENMMKSLRDMDFENTLEKLKKNGWWTRSNWAFLNETPVLERSTNTYVSQFHIANMAASKPGRGGVSAN